MTAERPVCVRVWKSAKMFHAAGFFCFQIMRSRSRWLIICCFAGWSALSVEANELYVAAQKGDIAAVKRLIESGAQIDASDGSGAKALYVAAKGGHTEIVVQLLAAGANPRHQAMGFYGSHGTALHAAVSEGHLEVARVLLEAGVDPNLADDGAGPPLHVATRRRQAESIKLLKLYGAGPRSAEPVDSLLATADVSQGEQMSPSCGACHALTNQPQERLFSGPSLWDVVGRAKAGVVGFEYSEALRQQLGVWTYADLSSFLADPRGFVPGTKMDWSGIKDRQRRAALIAYLRTLSDAPKPLH